MVGIRIVGKTACAESLGLLHSCTAPTASKRTCLSTIVIIKYTHGLILIAGGMILGQVHDGLSL